MKYLKTYELYSVGQNVEYEVGDIIVSILTKTNKNVPPRYILKEGEKYKAIRIYEIPEDKYLKNPFLRVDVENIETGEITKGWNSTFFKIDFEFDADKYNL